MTENAPQQPQERGGREQDGVEVRVPDDFPAGRAGRRPQGATPVAPVVLVDHVVLGPEQLVSRNGHHEMAAGSRHAPQLGERSNVVRSVFENVEAGDDVERAVPIRHVLHRAERHVVTSSARELHCLRARVETADARAVGKVVQHPARPAARVEQLRPALFRQPLDLGANDRTAAAVPPVTFLVIDHRLELGLLHRAILLPGQLMPVAVPLGLS
jgi:hypothetical protein